MDEPRATAREMVQGKARPGGVLDSEWVDRRLQADRRPIRVLTERGDPLKARVAYVSGDEERVQILFHDGREIEFHAAWLRKTADAQGA